MRGRQYVPVVDLRLLSSSSILRHSQSHDYHMTLKLARGQGKNASSFLRKLCEYAVCIGDDMARSSKLGRELMIYATPSCYHWQLTCKQHAEECFHACS